MGRLDGKVALVTGATGGIGEAIAKRFLEEGASVMLVGRSAEKLKATKGRLSGRGPIAQFVADVTDDLATAGAVAATVQALGGLDVAVANAGTEGVIKPVEQQTMDDFERVIRTNVIGTWLTLKHSIKPIRERGRGSMIAISSVAGIQALPGSVAYVASKHAVYGMVKTAAVELAASNIRVNAIAPGPIDNRMMASLAGMIAPGAEAAVRGGIEQSVPMKRYGTNEEVANMALFLASDESSYSTGGMFTVDGGFTAGETVRD